jgi:hypothetical protein
MNKMTNKYSGYCFVCGKTVEAGEGYAEIYKERWGVRCRPLCRPPDPAQRDVARNSAEHDAGAEGEINH